MGPVADAIDALVAVLKSEGAENLVVTADQVRAAQDELRAHGFDADTLVVAHAMGLTDADIQASLDARLATDPQSVAGNVIDLLSQSAGALRDLGARLATMPAYNSATSTVGSQITGP